MKIKTLDTMAEEADRDLKDIVVTEADVRELHRNPAAKRLFARIKRDLLDAVVSQQLREDKEFHSGVISSLNSILDEAESELREVM